MTPPCSSCGRAVPEGTPGCQALFDELLALEFGDYRYARVHRVTVDTYCVQHPDRYCASAKSLAAHLGGLCCKFDHGAHPAVYQALQRWLDGAAPLEKPELPSSRGALTIADVRGAPDPEAHARAVERWARCAWEAYAALHPLARGWVQAALAGRRASR